MLISNVDTQMFKLFPTAVPEIPATAYSVANLPNATFSIVAVCIAMPHAEL